MNKINKLAVRAMRPCEKGNSFAVYGRVLGMQKLAIAPWLTENLLLTLQALSAGWARLFERFLWAKGDELGVLLRLRPRSTLHYKRVAN